MSNTFVRTKKLVICPICEQTKYEQRIIFKNEQRIDVAVYFQKVPKYVRVYLPIVGLITNVYLSDALFITISPYKEITSKTRVLVNPSFPLTTVLNEGNNILRLVFGTKETTLPGVYIVKKELPTSIILEKVF